MRQHFTLTRKIEMNHNKAKSILVTKATAELAKEIEDELKIPDPSPEQCAAIIKKEKGKQNVKNSE